MDRGSAGGRETLKRYGVQHFKELGKRGIRATANKYFGGSIADCMDWLRRRGYEHKIAQGVDEQLQARLSAGEAITSIELPVICEPDADPSYWRDRVTASRREQEEIDLPF